MTSSISQRSSFRKLSLLVLLVAAVLSASTRIVSHADVAVPSTIRVALFINTGASVSTTLTSALTLQSAGGLNVGWKDPQFTAPIATIGPKQAVRFGMDGYRALLLETADVNAAMTALKTLQSQTNAAYVTQLAKSGKTVYQVSEGAYTTVAQAQAALTRWTNAGIGAGIQSLLSPRIAGPWAVEAGTYASQAEASAAAAAIGNASGLDAFVAAKAAGGAVTYTVRVGQEKDGSTLAALQQAVAAAGAQAATVPAPGAPYALLRQDVISGGVPATFFAVPTAAGVVLRADPAGAETIQISEKGNKTYRGSIETSIYNNSLAVVNDVGLEPYLYSVVGTEVGSGWPAEAQKAQAVAARSYALAAGMQFKIANVVDTTVSQAYLGTGAENANSTAGVDATKGEVIVNASGRIVSALFASNAGGITADSVEAWGNVDPTYASAAISPDDGPNAGKPQWVKVATGGGVTGYVREDLLAEASGKNAAGLKQMQATTGGVTIRSRPATDGDDLGKLSAGELVVPLGKVPEMTKAYSWVVGPYTADQLRALLVKRDSSLTGPLYTFEVSARGPSGRATELSANGKKLNLGQPDNFRGALGVNSTLFDVEETGRMTITDGQGAKRELPQQSGALAVVGADGQARTIGGGNLYVMDGSGNLRSATATAQFVISGKGWGHGLGMSQWGARGFAEQGYDYQYILQYYYKNVTIQKGQ